MKKSINSNEGLPAMNNRDHAKGSFESDNSQELSKKASKFEDKEKKKNIVEYPEKEKSENLKIMSGTEDGAINFATAGGEKRWYTMEDGNKGDGDSLYAKISKEKEEIFYLVDGKDIDDVGNFDASFYKNVNKEIEIGDKKYPMAVYLKRRDKRSRHETKRKSDIDIMRNDAYKFCFYDESIDDFITTNIDSSNVSRGEIKNWADVRQNEDNIIIDYPEGAIYDDGYFIKPTGGEKTFKISELISNGKIEKARELMKDGDSEKAKQIAETAVQLVTSEGNEVENFSKINNLFKVCQEFDLKEISKVSEMLINDMLKKVEEELNNKHGGEKFHFSLRLDEKLLKIEELLSLSSNKQNERDDILKEYKQKAFDIYFDVSNADTIFKFAEENNIDLKSTEMKPRMEKLAERLIESSMSSYNHWEDPLEIIEVFLDNEVNPEIIKKIIDKIVEKSKKSERRVYGDLKRMASSNMNLIKEKLKNQGSEPDEFSIQLVIFANDFENDRLAEGEKDVWKERNKKSIQRTLNVLKRLGEEELFYKEKEKARKSALQDEKRFIEKNGHTSVVFSDYIKILDEIEQ